MRLIGLFWVICGIVFLVFPQFLRWKIKKKGVRKLRRTILFLLLPLFTWLISLIFTVKGIVDKIGIIILIILLVKLVFYLASKFFVRIKYFFAQSPLKVFRVFAFSYIILGLIFLIFAA